MPSALAAELDARRPAASRSGRSAATTRVLVLPDQLSLEIGPVAAADPCSTEVWLVESGEWLSRRPYHRQRLAWILLLCWLSVLALPIAVASLLLAL